MLAKDGQCLEVEMSFGALERKIIRSLYGPVQEKSYWRIRYSNEICGLYKGTTQRNGMGWKHMQDRRLKKTEKKIYISRPIGKPNDRRRCHKTSRAHMMGKIRIRPKSLGTKN